MTILLGLTIFFILFITVTHLILGIYLPKIFDNCFIPKAFIPLMLDIVLFIVLKVLVWIFVFFTESQVLDTINYINNIMPEQFDKLTIDTIKAVYHFLMLLDASFYLILSVIIYNPKSMINIEIGDLAKIILSFILNLVSAILLLLISFTYSIIYLWEYNPIVKTVIDVELHT